MIESSIKVKLLHGLHMRPATTFAQASSKFKSKITLFNGDQMADGKSVMGILTLALRRGCVMKIVVDGPDEKKAMAHLKKLLANIIE